ncbi:Protein kinase C-like 1 [Mactra antiquata]
MGQTDLLINENKQETNMANDKCLDETLSRKLKDNCYACAPDYTGSVLYGNLNDLPEKVKCFIQDKVQQCQPDYIHICDGTEKERDLLLYLLQKDGTIKPLNKYENCWLARTDPDDVARVESKTFICTTNKTDTIPNTKDGVVSTLGNWMSPSDMDCLLESRFPGCMKGKLVVHDPFAMRPFFGYNFGHYLKHWLSFQDNRKVNCPKIFHVNWFRKGPEGFLWPGFGENICVLDWIFRRVQGEDCHVMSPVGYIPRPGSLNMAGLKQEVDMNALFELPVEFWKAEVDELEHYFDSQVGSDLPDKIKQELNQLKQRIYNM